MLLVAFFSSRVTVATQNGVIVGNLSESWLDHLHQSAAESYAPWPAFAFMAWNNPLSGILQVALASNAAF